MSGTRPASRNCVDCGVSIFEGKQGRNIRCESCKKTYKREYQKMDYQRNRETYMERAKVNYYKRRVILQDLET